MHKLVCSAALALTLATTPAVAQTIQPTDANAHVGQAVTIEGIVSEVHVAQRSDTTFIDLGGEYPNEAFTGVIFSEDESKFPDVQNLTGKKVNISGTISLYKGRPEIILHSADQLKAP
ncbi:MAG: hypothetical protein WDN02_11025 [Methylovirgula sp.]|uniref:hypothetical protein n=1 Tax=Methylovirgula sp. TaxID=1978224 RepID=UPI0030761BB2